MSTPEQPLVAVRGEVVLEVEPEIATLSVTLGARDPDRAKVLARLNERGEAVQAILATFQPALDKVETSAVRISPQLKDARAKERVTGYVGTVQHTIVVSAFDRLAELVARLADQEMTEVVGPWWALRPDSPVHRQVRIDAARDAVQRAREYAAALGSALTELVELADSRLLSAGFAAGGPAPAERAFVRTLSAHGSAPDTLTFDLEPVKQTVRATVDARFRITPPDLGLTGARATAPTT